MKRLIVHIGYPKTATSTLQRNILGPLHRDGQIRYLGNNEEVGIAAVGQTDRLIRSFLMGNSGVSLPSDIRSALPTRIDLHKEFRKSPGYLSPLLDKFRVNVISLEHITIPFWVAGNSEDAAIRIAEMFNDGDTTICVIITLRNQVDLIESFFSHFFGIYFYPYEYLDSVSKVFFNRNDEVSNNGYVAAFNFRRQLRHWIEIFGNDHVYVNLLEHARHDTSSFLDPWSRLLDIDIGELVKLFSELAPINVRDKNWRGEYKTRVALVDLLARKSDWMKRRILGGRNSSLELPERSTFGKLRKAINVRISVPRLTDSQRKKLQAHYADENRKLFTEKNIPLPTGLKFGYF